MPYNYTVVTLESIDPVGTNIRPVKSFFPAPPATTPEFSIGELVRMELEVNATTGGSKFRAGEQFCFNLRMFSAPGDIHHFIPNSRGWLIKIRQGAGGLVADWNLSTGGQREPVDKNFSINSISFPAPNDRTIAIQFDFYITQDVQDWIGFGTITNTQRWRQNQPLAPDVLDNSTDSAFKRLESYMELAFFQCDSNLLPFTLTGPATNDPIARDPNNPQYETFAIKLGLKWYDQIVGAQNDWVSPTAKADNWLKSIEINAGNYTTPITQVTHKGYPADYENTPRNFIFDRDGISTTQLVINNAGDTTAQKNNVTIVIGSPNLLDYSTVVVQLIRVGQENDGVDFTESYQLSAASIPKLEPAVTVLDGPIETPSAWAVAAGELTLDFIINGEKLEAGADYQIIVLLYKNDGGDDFSSSTGGFGTMSTTAANVGLPTVQGFIDTYNNSFGPAVNDVSIASFERIKLRLVVDSNPYGVAEFLTDLQGIRLSSTLLGQTVADISSSTFPAGVPTSNPRVITVTDLGGGIWEFAAEFRGYYAATVPGRSFHKWELIFNPVGPNQQSWVGRFEQRLTHRPEDTVRLPAMRVLEFGVFPGILTEKIYICENLDEKVVIEVEKNGAPDANLIAMILNDTPTLQPPGVIPSVDEEESYASPYLPTLTSPHISQVDTAFSTQLDPNKAYFVVDVDFLTTQKFFNALIYNI